MLEIEYDAHPFFNKFTTATILFYSPSVVIFFSSLYIAQVNLLNKREKSKEIIVPIATNDWTQEKLAREPYCFEDAHVA